MRTFDQDDRLVVANRAFLANNHAIVDLIKPGIAFEDILRAQIAAGIVPDALGREEAWIRDRLDRHREPRGPFELRRSNGRYLQVSDLRLADGGSVTIATDITAIRRREERFRALLESAPDAMVIVDEVGRITNVNRMAQRLTGYSRQDLLALHIEALIPERFRGPHHEFTAGFFAAPSARLMGEGRELFCLTKTGEEVPVEISLNAIDTDDGRLVVAGIRDISERRKAQEALRQARDELEQRVLDRTAALRAEIAERQWAEARAEAANLAKSKFLSSMSHELRTPLNAILGFAQLLDEFSEPPLSDDQGDSVEQILRAGRHLLDLVNEVLDLSKIDAGRIELNRVALDPREVVGDCLVLIRPLADERHIAIDDATAAGGARFLGDAVRVKQVLLNVLSNAVKYNRENGRIRVATQPLDGAMLRISVTDTGVGIVADKHQEVFEPFTRVGAEMTAIEGTGIGLTISRRLVEMMGGRMGLESALGVGSTFWFELPLAETEE